MELHSDSDSSSSEGDEVDQEIESRASKRHKMQQLFEEYGSDSARISWLFEKETEMMPREDYLTRIQSEDPVAAGRHSSIECIYAIHRHYSFQPLTVCLAVSYLDRFLSERKPPRDESSVKLLSVACLSLAAKMEEFHVPSPLVIHVIEGMFLIEAKTICKMEGMLLEELDWRTNAVTPLSFIHLFLHRLQVSGYPGIGNLNSPLVELVLTTTKVAGFLEFLPSEIALAVVISVVRRTHGVKFRSIFDDSCCSSASSSSSLVLCHSDEEMVWKCCLLIHELKLR